MKRYAKPHSAFTLVELSLVTLILAIIAAVSIPNFKSLWAKTEMQQVSAHLVGALRYAQQRAILERLPIQIYINVDKNSFYIPVEQEEEKRTYRSRGMRRSHSSSHLRSRSNSNRRKKYVKEIVGRLPDGFIFEFVYKVANDDEIRRGEEPFTFYPDGSADSAFFTILRLAKDERDEYRLFIKVNPATGGIKMMEGRTENDGSRFYLGYNG